MNDRRTAILLAVIIIMMIIFLGFLWYLATERTALTDKFDPQCNLEESL